MALEPKVHNLVIDKTLSDNCYMLHQRLLPWMTVLHHLSLEHHASTNVDRFIPNHNNDGMLNVYYILRKKKARQAAEEHWNIEMQSWNIKARL